MVAEEEHRDREPMCGGDFQSPGADKADCIEGMGMFKYFWSLLDQLEDDWLEVLRNIRKSRQVWGRLQKILRREGEETFIS